MPFKLGADPELFLKDAAEAYVSAIGLIGGTKESPKPLPIGEGFAVQEDNVAVEYNIPAANSRQEFNSNIQQVMDFLGNEVSRMGLHFATDSAVTFPDKELRHPMAKVFGCDPDFNAWTGEVNPRPRAMDKKLRTCGGHVHIGYQFTSVEEVNEFIKHMDLFTMGAAFMDKGERRKQLYGSAGALRYKPYGCEYRSLSNFWIFKPEHREWVWNCTEQAMHAWQNKTVDINSEKDSILLAINKNNKRVAEQLINKYDLLVC